MLINAFSSGGANDKRVELCRFTTSGTFNPADYPTADGLYDVYIVGGGGGRYKNTTWNSSHQCVGGGGGYAKLIKDISVSSPTPVIVGSAGHDSGSDDAQTAGGATSFGSYTVSGGGCATSTKGGDGGCGGAGFNGLMGGVDGHDGSCGEYSSSSQTTVKSGVAGVGGGDVDYCPRNPYDNKSYGVGGNGNALFGNTGNTSLLYSGNAGMLPTNYNPGRGSGEGGGALPGICIVYGIPKY